MPRVQGDSRWLLATWLTPVAGAGTKQVGHPTLSVALRFCCFLSLREVVFAYQFCLLSFVFIIICVWTKCMGVSSERSLKDVLMFPQLRCWGSIRPLGDPFGSGKLLGREETPGLVKGTIFIPFQTFTFWLSRVCV